MYHRAGGDGRAFADVHAGGDRCVCTDPYPGTDDRPGSVCLGAETDVLLDRAAWSDLAVCDPDPAKMADIEAGADVSALFQPDAVGKADKGYQQPVRRIETCGKERAGQMLAQPGEPAPEAVDEQGLKAEVVASKSQPVADTRCGVGAMKAQYISADMRKQSVAPHGRDICIRVEVRLFA